MSWLTVQENADKTYLLELARRGLPVVPSFVAQTDAEALPQARSLASGGLVVKPTVSGGSYLTYVLREERELLPSLGKVLAHGPALLQPYLPTVASEGEISLIYFRRGSGWRYSHAVLKTAASGEFRVQSDFGGKVEAFEPAAMHFGLAERCLAATTRPGDLYARLDFVNWRISPLIGEVELIEPALFFEFGREAPEAFARTLEESSDGDP